MTREERPTTLVCPECGGVLNQDRSGRLSHFRCQVGHAYSLETLQAEQDGRVEAALWTVMRAIKEKTEIATRLAQEARARGDGAEAARQDKTSELACRDEASILAILERR